jgi:ribosomal protein L11 methyltransferase
LKWIEIRLDLSPELVEPVSELLSRYIPAGISIAQNPRSAFPASSHTSYAVTGWLPGDDEFVYRRRSIAEGLWHLSQINPIPSPTYREIEQENWVESWKADYKPIAIGEKLLVVPAWFEPPEGRRIPIFIEHGMAFGTGTHPTTQLCLVALEKYVQPGDVLLDIGTGTGILTIAGILLGAGYAIAVDVEEQAVNSARGNCRINQISDQVTVVPGSLPEVQIYLAQKRIVPSCLVMNMVERKLIDLIDAGVCNIIPNGKMCIVSGLLEDQLPAFLERAKYEGLSLREVLTHGEWRGIIFVREPLTRTS